MLYISIWHRSCRSIYSSRSIIEHIFPFRLAQFKKKFFGLFFFHFPINNVFSNNNDFLIITYNILFTIVNILLLLSICNLLYIYVSFLLFLYFLNIITKVFFFGSLILSMNNCVQTLK